MGKKALLVDDELESIEYAEGVLAKHGFETDVFQCSEDALRAAELVVEQDYDLVVLDRRLPQTMQDEPSSEVGDLLLDSVAKVLPGTPIVVFSAYSNSDHVDFVYHARGGLDVNRTYPGIDRVRFFDKMQQTDKFDAYLGEISAAIDSTNALDLKAQSSELTWSERRCLRLVTAHLGGRYCEAQRLTAGLTGMPVWRATVFAADSSALAQVIVKIKSPNRITPVAGIHTVLPASRVASCFLEFSSLCGRNKVQVSQLAGGNVEV